MPRLTLTALLVKDYDEAIAFYAGKLGFEVREDTQLSADKRWVIVAPRGGGGSLLLARATDDRQRADTGEQSGGRVFLFLETDDFARDHADYSAKGVTFIKNLGLSHTAGSRSLWTCKVIVGTSFSPHEPLREGLTQKRTDPTTSQRRRVHMSRLLLRAVRGRHLRPTADLQICRRLRSMGERPPAAQVDLDGGHCHGNRR